MKEVQRSNYVIRYRKIVAGGGGKVVENVAKISYIIRDGTLFLCNILSMPLRRGSTSDSVVCCQVIGY